MKTIFKIALSVTAFFVLSSCGAKNAATANGATEVAIPISNFDSDKTYIRGIGQGTSYNMSMAKELAYTDAARNIAKSINLKLNALFEDYSKNAQIDGSNDFKSESESMTKTTVSESLKNLRVAKEKVFQNTDKTYTYYIGLELNKEEIYQSLSTKASNSKLKELHQSKVEFRESFNKTFEE